MRGCANCTGGVFALLAVGDYGALLEDTYTCATDQSTIFKASGACSCRIKVLHPTGQHIRPQHSPAPDIHQHS